MNRRRPLATLLASLALHGGVLLAVLVFVSRESELGALFIDLTEWAEPRTGGTYRRPLGNDPLTLDPPHVTENYSIAVVQQVFDGLVQYDEVRSKG